MTPEQTFIAAMTGMFLLCGLCCYKRWLDNKARTKQLEEHEKTKREQLKLLAVAENKENS
jgi:hypothetical protein